MKPADIRLLPRPRSLTLRPGAFRLPANPEIELGQEASDLSEILLPEWPGETADPILACSPDPGFFFRLGTPPPAPALPDSRQGFVLAVGPKGLIARARTYPGLLYAWQALKQLLRQFPARLPALVIRDWPDLDQRWYHIDLKGTRRTFANLLAILPDLAECRINGILAEYEDAVRFDRHPDIATPEAMTPLQVKAFVTEAAKYGITVVPLVQTLGHLQFLLSKPAYAHLREEPSDPSEACSTHPGTWPLIRDFIDELIAMHPGVPYLHVGLDETHRVGTCPRCRKRLKGGPRITRYLDWVNQVVDHCRTRGVIPMLWGDVISRELDESVVRRLPKDAVYCDWGYHETGPLHFSTRLRKGLVSREWLKRPEGRIDTLPRIGFNGRAHFIEDLPAAERRAVQPFLSNPEAPQWVPSDATSAAFHRHGLDLAIVSAVRASFHGNIASRFITGQLNAIQAANACKRHGGRMVIASSWSRGHSLAGMDAHPELDWYGIASLGAAGWSDFGYKNLRDFDVRFAFQFFGLPDGEIADLYFQHERTSVRADHSSENYLPRILERLALLRPKAARHAGRLDLFRSVCEAHQLRFRAQFALLEMEYFYPIWERVPPAFAARILADAKAVDRDIRRLKPALVKRYAESILRKDAVELACTQLDFHRDLMLAMAAKLRAR